MTLSANYNTFASIAQNERAFIFYPFDIFVQLADMQEAHSLFYASLEIYDLEIIYGQLINLFFH